jgi:hypothetical protein
LAPPDAVTVPLAVTGGHAPAHAPLQLDVPPVSFAHRYTARPEPSVRKVPAEDEAVSMTVAPDVLALLPEDDAPAGEPLAAPVVLLLALLHAATSSAAPSAPPTPATSLVLPDTRLNMEFPILLVSGPAGHPRQLSSV